MDFVGEDGGGERKHPGSPKNQELLLVALLRLKTKHCLVYKKKTAALTAYGLHYILRISPSMLWSDHCDFLMCLLPLPLFEAQHVTCKERVVLFQFVLFLKKKKCDNGSERNKLIHPFALHSLCVCVIFD